MQRSPGAEPHLVLVGGGHTHAHVLKSFGMRRPPAVRVTVVTPSPHSAYSGMVPGALAGLYEPADFRIDFAALAARAGAGFVEDRMVAIRPDARQILAERAGTIPYDLISLDVGAQPLGLERVAMLANVVPVRPMEACVARVDEFLADVAAGRRPPLAAVVGGGAGGVEIAFALRRRLAPFAGAQVVLAERGPALVAESAPRVRSFVMARAVDAGIDVRVDVGDVDVDEDGLALQDGTRVPAALVVWATGAEGLDVLRRSGLATDERGFVLVDRCLRSVSRPEVFAAGDCARMRDHPEMPRAGVYAVRQGPPLTATLRAVLSGHGRMRPYRPQSGFLSLLSTGDGRAIVNYRGRAAHGRVWWWLKDAIDRRFVARHAPPRAGRVRAPGDAAMGGRGEMAPCGGCAAKVDASALASLLRGVAPQGLAADGVAIGLAAPDDAAVLAHPEGFDVVATIDAFPPFFGDLFAVGDVAAVNAASDVFAMGGIPSAALVLVASAAPAGAARDADLGLLLRGAAAGLARMGIALVGGHTLDAGTSLVGVAVLGRVARGAAWTKGGARPGDRLVLTKPLGTGVVLAATRAGECDAAWTASAVAAMRAPNAEAAALLGGAGVRACTDVSGFGLVGHLREMLRAGGVAARVDLAALPALPGALELLAAGWRSSADASNRALLAGASFGSDVDQARVALACDPQTSGGLLAAVPADACASLLDALGAAGVAAAAIGEIVAGPSDALDLA
ncbi:MAG TPA: selenide, water dikinase SelD [Candidatus Binatia bacterium]|nr:selenide, water dikinase SelD [Candidatus Binatia bacterium]